MAATLVSENISSLVEQFDGTCTVEVKPFVPGDLRQVQIHVGLPAQRRTVGEIDAFGQSLRNEAREGVVRLLGTVAGVVDALSFAPQALVGQVESQWLEAKRELYDLTRPQQKIELAKDVAALANSGGGLIIFGFSTRSEGESDRITHARHIDTSSLNTNQYMQVLRARVHPFPERIKIVRLGDTSAGFAFIRIPKQAEELFPFMLRQTASADGVRSVSLTIPVRREANVEYASPESIHALIVAGRAALRGSPRGPGR